MYSLKDKILNLRMLYRIITLFLSVASRTYWTIAARWWSVEALNSSTNSWIFLL